MKKKNANPFSSILNYAQRPRREWCRMCAKEIYSDKVVDFAVKKWNKPLCWNCQQIKKIQDACKHENTIDVGDTDHCNLVCTDCGKKDTEE